jgi:hypothetical protein
MRRLLLSAASALVVLVGHAVLPAGERAEEPYSFSVNGESLIPPRTVVEGTTKQPAPGDVVDVLGFRMVLGPQRTQHYYYDYTKQPQVLWIETPDRQRAPAAVRVTWEYKSVKEDYRRELNNPLRKLGAEQISRLRGVSVEGWADDLPVLLAKLDLQHVCIQAIDDSTGKDPGRIYPLPPSVRYLCVKEHSNQGIRDWHGLLRFKELQSLDVEAMTVAFDCKALEKASQLRHLSLRSWRGLTDPQTLRKLAALRSLDLSFNQSLTDVGFATELSHLRELRLDSTEITDLTALGGHPALETIDAQFMPLRRLPLDRPLLALRRLDILGTAVPDADVARFGKLNPQSEIDRHYLPKLAKVLSGADRVRVRDTDEPTKTMYVEENLAQVRALTANLGIDDSQCVGHCMCIGWPGLEFYRQGKLVATLSDQHGLALRWNEGWPRDGVMTAASASYVNGWLADHVPAVRAQQQAARAYQDEQAREMVRFLEPFPPQLRPLLSQVDGTPLAPRGTRQFSPIGDGATRKGRGLKATQNSDPIVRQLLAQMPDEVAMAVACCRALGSLEGSTSTWTVTTDKERRVLAAMGEVGGDSFTAALGKLKGEPRALIGAGRLYFREELSARMTEAARNEWTAPLAEAVLADRLSKNDANLLLALTQFNDPRTTLLLGDVVRGKKGVEPTEHQADEPTLRVGAALTLANERYSEIKPDLETLLAATKSPLDRAGLEVSLALLGDLNHLKAEQFRSRSFAVALGAIQAVERSKGAYGLDLLIENALEHPWAHVRDEAPKAVGRITGKKFSRREREAIREWWKTEGAAFVAERRKQVAPSR